MRELWDVSQSAAAQLRGVAHGETVDVRLVLGGLVLGGLGAAVPGLPHVALAPDVVFLILLPPLV
jgi:hypothetical protein